MWAKVFSEDNPMTPLQFLFVLRARYKLALFTMFAVVVIAQAASFLQPKQYIATTSLVVDVRSPDPVAAMLAPLNLATQVEIINSDRVAQKVVKNLKLDENPSAKEQWIEKTEGKGRLEVWMADRLKRKLTAQPSRDSTIISISYTAADPVFAATVANAFAQAYVDATIELKVEPARQFARWFGEQGKSLRENLEKAQARISAFLQEKGLVAKDEQFDNETARLNELSQQLTAVQAHMTITQSRQRSGNAADTLPEVMQNPLITGLKTEIARQEARLQEMAVNLGKNHPQYQRMESEVAALKQQVDAETRHITRSFATTRTVGKDTETELKAAIEAQKKKLLALKSVRDELAVLQRDLAAAQSAYDAVIGRLNQTTLESQVTQANVSVLTPASEPIEPLTSKLFRNPWITILLGALAGIGVAYTLEMLDKRVRSVHDLKEMLQVPVLGVIENGRSRARLTFARRSIALLAK
jgi:succinoglycan biosynthesis transport protein ExoP